MKRRATSFLGFGTAQHAPTPVVPQVDPAAERLAKLKSHAATILTDNQRSTRIYNVRQQVSADEWRDLESMVIPANAEHYGITAADIESGEAYEKALAHLRSY